MAPPGHSTNPARTLTRRLAVARVVSSFRNEICASCGLNQRVAASAMARSSRVEHRQLTRTRHLVRLRRKLFALASQ